ncbi:unnamed protein product, partial [Rotaria sp. Silwood2]
FLLNLHELAIVSSSSVETKSSNVSSQVSLNNSLTYIHTISIQQPIIYFIWFTLCIKLKKYINTNESGFQAAVLDLLVQLLIIRVNYSYILFCCIAEYLVMLSHDTLHSKQVIKVQDLIKHYDLLLASGHEPETHALAALEPVLYDFFLVRVMRIIKIPKTFY